MEAFFAPAGPERTGQITHISADMGSWIHAAVGRVAPQAEARIDLFHVVSLATEALDQVRRDVWNATRTDGDETGARWLKGAPLGALGDRRRS